MSVSLAKEADLVEVMYLLKVCTFDLSSQGCLYWHFVIPQVVDDLKKEKLFMLRKNEVCLGIMTLEENTSEEYKNVKWQSNGSRVLTVYRLIVHPKWNRKETGIKDQLLKFAEDYAKQNGYEAIRIDVFGDNNDAIEMFRQMKYLQAGEIHMPYQTTPFICFEKLL
jgi:ribosomal protein S18 acetylase RimI-like enzyme